MNHGYNNNIKMDVTKVEDMSNSFGPRAILSMMFNLRFP
jgi:hypothetical protein